MTARDKRAGDFSQVARRVVQEATTGHDDDAIRAADEAHAQALRDDPATQAWLDDAHASVADGSFDERVSAQPDPREAAEKFKARRR